jgi:phosphotriesterase-related protein
VDTAIPTARGDAVLASELGVTLMHEHVFALSTEINLNYPETFGDEEQRIAEAVKELNEAKQSCVDTIVDVTAIGLGRYIPRIQRVAAQTSINIIVATGLYTWNDLPMFFSTRGPGSAFGGPEIMTDFFVKDITEGIADTGVRAGILKCATDRLGITPAVDRVLRAVAQAHRQTGVPITTHTFDAPNGLDQQRVFLEEGVDLSRVVIGHIARAAITNMAYVTDILKNGSYVAFDQLGLPAAPLDQTIARIVQLCNAGFTNRIVLSHDHPVYSDVIPSFVSAERPDWRYTLLNTRVAPLLREAGLSEASISTMLVDNPRRIYETTGLGAY